MPRYCHNRPLGTAPNANIRIRTNIRTLCSSAPCGSVAKTAAKMSKKCDQGDAGALRAGFSLILGLVVNSYPVIHLDTGNLLQFRWVEHSILFETMESVAILKQLAAGFLRRESGPPRQFRTNFIVDHFRLAAFEEAVGALKNEFLVAFDVHLQQGDLFDAVFLDKAVEREAWHAHNSFGTVRDSIARL